MRVVILTKVPVPGRVKTRLAGLLSPVGSARLHTALAEETVRRALRTGLPVTVSLAGDLQGVFVGRLRDLGVRLEPQAQGDLGARLSHALRGPGRAVALGTDCVTFQPSWLLDALQAAEPVAFGPSNDGGYWAVACDGTGGSSRTERVFSGIPWSTPQTLSASLRAAAAAGLTVGSLPPCYDIDEPADLHRLRQDPGCAPALRHTIESLLASR